MPTLDIAAEVALDEGVGLCQDPIGRHADLIRWLSLNPKLALELAHHLAGSDEGERGSVPRKADATAPAERTLSFGAAEGVEANRDAEEALQFGDFEILGELGRGGMGVVYKARHTVLNKIVALKTVLASGFPSQRELLRFRYEAASAARLDHPNIVPIYGIGDYQGMPFFSMKHITGGTLGQAMAEQRRDLKKAAALMAKVARAVQFAHDSGIIHRDLKPGNILLENGEPMIADFGLAKALDAEDGLSSSGAIVGTPAFMAPEQARADKGWSTASDTYSLGAILYQLLTGRPPFRGDTVYETLRMVIDQVPAAPKTINPDAPPDLEAICMKCLEKNAANRYAHADTLAKDLERFSRGDAVSVRPRTLFSQIGRAVVGHREDVGPANESWLKSTRNTLGIATVTHAAIFGLILGGSTMSWVWVTLGGFFGFTGIIRVGQILRSRAFFPWERHMVVLWSGYTVCALGLALALLPYDPDSSAEHAIAWYPPLTVLLGMAIFIQASISDGAHYIAGFIYLITAVVLRYCGIATPLVFLVFHVAMQVFMFWIVSGKWKVTPPKETPPG